MSKRRWEARYSFALSLIVFVIFGVITSWGYVRKRVVIDPLYRLEFYEVSPKVLESRLIDRVAPVYPEYAKHKGIQGAVVLYAMIDKRGHVNNLAVASGRSELYPAALDAAKYWRYRPYLVHGEPVWVSSRITVNFSLPEQSSSPISQ